MTRMIHGVSLTSDPTSGKVLAVTSSHVSCPTRNGYWTPASGRCFVVATISVDGSGRADRYSAMSRLPHGESGDGPVVIACESGASHHTTVPGPAPRPNAKSSHRRPP